MQEEEALGLVVIFIAAGVALAIQLAIAAVLCWLLSGWLKRVPAEHRKQEPGKVWLMLIPLFNLYWAFQVLPPMAESFDSYFKAKNEPAESALGLAKIFCWTWVGTFIGSMVPCLGMIVGPVGGLATLVLLILVLVKFHGLAQRLPAAAAA